MQSRGLVLLIFVEIAQGWKAEGGGWEGGGGGCLLPYSLLQGWRDSVAPDTAALVNRVLVMWGQQGGTLSCWGLWLAQPLGIQVRGAASPAGGCRAV